MNTSAIKVTAGYGRLYVSGPGYRRVLGIPGATDNAKRASAEVSLTLDTLRAIKQQMGYSSHELARYCAPEVMRWATAAAAMEKRVTEVHRRIQEGWRREFPWTDNTGGRDGQYRAGFDHQKVMASVATELDGCAFICDMGTGKTRGAVESIRWLLNNNAVQCVIVFCPKNVQSVWEDEFDQWTTGIRATILRGTVAARRNQIRMWRPTPAYPQVMLLNYDVVHSLAADLKQFMRTYKVGLTLDEMHRIKNPDAKVTKACLELAQVAAWRLGMTGTPVLQGIQDVWSQWYVVDLGITFGSNYVQYRREYMTEDAYTFTLDPRPGSLDKVGLKMRRRGIRYTKADCLDLPPKTFERQNIEMTPRQKAAYLEMERLLIARLSESEYDDVFATAANQLVMILRLTQITSGFVPDENGIIHRFVPNPKLDVLEEVVREQLPYHQIIVWARYTEDVASICERMRNLNPIAIVGEQAIPKIRQRGIPVPSRDDAKRLFQSGANRLLVANPEAGGEGLNLYAASLAIYYSQGYSLKHRLQSEDRCHRSGSEIHEKVTYLDLICENSVDEIVSAALAGKKAVADVVVDLRRHLGLDT